MVEIPAPENAGSPSSLDKKSAVSLFLISFLALFFEMFFIRYISSQVRIIGYYTNLVLIACFLGLGAGCLLSKSRFRLINYFPLLLIILTGLTGIFKNLNVVAPTSELLYLQYDKPVLNVNLYYCLSLFYVIITLTTMPLGQEMGILFNRLSPITAYSINIGGSILGVLSFSIFSMMSLPPIIWFLIAAPILLWFMADQKKWFIANALLILVCMGIILNTTKGAMWSPYHKIVIAPVHYGSSEKQKETTLKRFDYSPVDPTLPIEYGFDIQINEKSYQTPLNLSDEAVKKYPFLKIWQDQYRFPYDYIKADDVLILGGGTGNDAACAIRCNAKNIDVVDIEPMLLDIGRKKHPEHPYSNPRVTVYADDARSFFHKTKKKYDIIIISFLDSHIISSSMANARLDSYVYTVESFKEARKHLKKGGLLSVSFSTPFLWMMERLHLMMKTAFGTEPYFNRRCELGNHLLVGENMERFKGREMFIPETTRMTTDDWPFFYLESNFISKEYVITLLIIVIISAMLVFLCIFRAGIGFDLHFFLLGCAFMLIETKSITTISVLFGSTWIVNSIVIISILVMILLANLYILKGKPISINYSYIFLGVSIIINFITPIKTLQLDNFMLKLLLSGILIASPIFFAGIIFATSFRKSRNPDLSLGFNILGGVVGGVLEYQSLVTGFNYLFIIALLLYFMSYLFIKKS